MGKGTKTYVVMVVAFVLSVFLAPSVLSASTKWQELKKGLEYTKIRTGSGLIHALRVDPKRYRFGVVRAQDIGEKGLSVREMGRSSSALVAINGGFFTPEYDSLGLLIDKGKELNPLKKTSWWSVFYVKNNVPQIVHTNSFKKSSSIDMALQCGPRLLVHGHIPKLKNSLAERSAVCVDDKGNVVLAATENLLISTEEMAEHLKKGAKEGGAGCITALNLDGGSSTQLYAHVGTFNLNVIGLKKVANAIVVYDNRGQKTKDSPDLF